MFSTHCYGVTVPWYILYGKVVVRITVRSWVWHKLPLSYTSSIMRAAANSGYQSPTEYTCFICGSETSFYQAMNTLHVPTKTYAQNASAFD